MTRTSAPPGPSVMAGPSLLWRLSRDRLGLMRLAAAEYGDVARIPIGPKVLYFFNHPDHARHVLADNPDNYRKGLGLAQAKRALGDGLLTSEGELWRKQRTVIQPVFQHRRMAGQAAVVAQEAAGLVDRLRAHQGGGPVDVVREMTRLTLGVLGRTLLDADLTPFTSVDRSFAAMQDQAMFEVTTLGMVPMWVPLPRQLRFRRARRDLQRIVDALVVTHADRADGAGDDALSRLVASTRDEPDPLVGRQRMRDELVTLLLAGHETTASTLSWAFHLLDRHPQVRARLREEARDVLGDRLPEYEDLHRLRYTSMVVNEVIRLYPPVWMLSRSAKEADEVDGYAVPAGSDVLICPYTLHRHPDFWPRPDEFDPDRFAVEGSVDRPRYAYIPFGAGPRFCVGNNLGLMEAVFVVAMVTRDLTLNTVRGYRVVPEPMLSLRIKGGLPMTVD
jgi:cytochrome P450